MTRCTLTICIVSLIGTLTLPPAAAAQLHISINTGVTLPSEDSTTFYTAGFNVSSLIDYQIGRYIAVGGRVGWHRLPLDEAALLRSLREARIGGVSEISNGEGTASNTLSAMGTVRLIGPISAIGSFYALGGVGQVFTSSEEVRVPVTGGTYIIRADTTSALGVQVGGGVFLGEGPTYASIEVGYMTVYREGLSATALLPIRIGVVLSL